MKKLYLSLLTLFFGLSVGFLFFIGNQNNTEQKEFTPKQLWEINRLNKIQNPESKKNKPDEFTQYFKDITTKFNSVSDEYKLNYRVNEFQKAKSKAAKQSKSENFSTVWKARGPGNVGGRTRGLIVDPDDSNHNTWFAGSATGGVWKTTDGGENWTCLTDDFPNLSANTIAMANSNHNILYVGTGESFPGGTFLKGNGIFKSTNKGGDFTQLASTINNDDFEYVNRIVIDPDNANIVLAATESGIMKSINGGTDWIKVYLSENGVEDLVADTTNFNLIYGGENSTGVIKSSDAGETWALVSNGIEIGDRYELAIAPTNPAKIYLSLDIDDNNSSLYRSEDYGITWKRFYDADNFHQFLGTQGSYDNTIAIHPFNEDIAFIAGVDLFKADFSNPGTLGNPVGTVTLVDTSNTASFLDFQNFSAAYFGGAMDIGTNNNAISLLESDFVSVEIRFGPGISQMAHRFTVPATSGASNDGGAGVSASEYEYQDYVEVPFQVWDVTNNKQLMASFRDQEREGKFNLIERSDDPVSGREYLFANAVDYSETASTDIAKKGGHSYKQLYFFWPKLATGATWDYTNLPTSKISIEWGNVNIQNGKAQSVADAYGRYGGGNPYDETVNSPDVTGVHPDHHNLVLIPINESTNTFTILNANDGGMAISTNSGTYFTQIRSNYVTTQFYGVAKKPNANEYIGGMQDNSTWRSPTGEDATANSQYVFQVGGDGFECLWNSENENFMLATIYNNSIYRTTNGGATWSSSTSGIEDGDGPFITRLSSHQNAPNTVFAVGNEGIYKSSNFGSNWKSVSIDNNWTNGGVKSSHNVEVSVANENIVWAGAAMGKNLGWSIHVSTDQGETFAEVSDFTGADMSGYISGIATHPFEDSTAYILFSFAKEPKVLRTKDLGKTWEDLTGFVGNVSSDNGFPDVVTHSLVVLPNDPSTIWVGTDIGLFESNDDGQTWHYSNKELPAVSVYDMFIQDGQVVVATHGRGIWTADIEEIANLPVLSKISANSGTLTSETSYEIAFDSVELFVNNNLVETIKEPSTGANTLSYVYPEIDTYKFNIIGYQNGNMYRSNNVRIELSTVGIVDFSKNRTNHLKVYPNPTQGNVTIDLPENLNKSYTIDVYSLSGSKVYSKLITRNDNQLNLEKLNNGIYIIRLENDGEIYSQKVKIQK
jgi:photosystem II stability/assembly factor-like uncharacterized protein